MILIIAGLTIVATLVLFAIDILDNEPQTFVAMVAIVLLAFVLNFAWKMYRDAHSAATEPVA